MDIKNVTVGDIIAFILGLATVIGACGVILKLGSKAFTKALEKAMKPTNDRLDGMAVQILEVDMSQCKNFLVRFLADVEQGNQLDEIEKERFYETYEHYIKNGGNSYIKDKVARLRRSGKL